MSILHICNGFSTAGSFRLAGLQNVLIFTLGFDGPLKDFQSYGEYRKVLWGFYRSLIDHELHPPVEELFYVQSTQKNQPPAAVSGELLHKTLKEHEEIFLWISAGFAENLLLAFLVRLFDLYQVPLRKLRIKQITHRKSNVGTFRIRSMAEVPPHALVTEAKIRLLQEQEAELLRSGWQALTHPSPGKLIEYIKRPSVTLFQKGLNEFIQRLPSRTDGLNFCERMLLKAYQVGEESMSVARLIGEVISVERLDFISEYYARWRLENLSDHIAKNPAFVFDNSASRPRVSLTDFGRTLCKGTAKWFDENDIDYYVGGLHTSTAPQGTLHFVEDVLNPIQKLS